MLIRLSASLHYPYGEKVLLQEHDIQIVLSLLCRWHWNINST